MNLNNIILDEYGVPIILDKRDTCHNCGFVSFSLYLQNKKDLAESYNKLVRKVCWKLFWPFKNPTYWFSNSGSANPEENTWAKRFTYMLYHKVLKYLPFTVKSNSPEYVGGIDIKKGLNGDQFIPMLSYMLLANIRYPVFKWVLGIILRLGFYPNGEHILFKLNHLSVFFRMLRLKPIYWILDIFFYFSASFAIDNQDVSNIIRIYLYLVSAKKQDTCWIKYVVHKIRNTVYGSVEKYFKNAYSEYWNSESEKDKIIMSMPFNLLENYNVKEIK